MLYALELRNKELNSNKLVSSQAYFSRTKLPYTLKNASVAMARGIFFALPSSKISATYTTQYT